MILWILSDYTDSMDSTDSCEFVNFNDPFKNYTYLTNSSVISVNAKRILSSPSFEENES